MDNIPGSDTDIFKFSDDTPVSNVPPTNAAVPTVSSTNTTTSTNTTKENTNDSNSTQEELDPNREPTAEEIAEFEKRKQELIRKAKEDGDFDEKEVEALIDSAKIYSEKIIINYMKAIIDDNSIIGDGTESSITQEIQAKRKEMLDYLDESLTIEYTGYIEFEFQEVKEKLRLQLSVVPRAHVFETAIPHEKYGNQVYYYIEYLIKCCMSYYKTMLFRNKPIFEKTKEYFDLINCPFNFSQMYFDKSNITCCFNEDSSQRIGVLLYYVDEQGRPMIIEAEEKTNTNKNPQSAKKKRNRPAKAKKTGKTRARK